ncbi:molybdenum cofactor cytidylyltransferase [Litoreibacter ponti]|uniref:Molybdenum cofactor cytidylyltransferase n=1 Tax=Litoreibacter ponti TaxID=1510457 RepID=A0A2T6BHW8_9RHOB|nr:molybdopterin-binding protein [Litoreibacter ponti]PTX55657.1 molybdenum cofactor cytidylyltransferase [Litoreibacter ponti]
MRFGPVLLADAEGAILAHSVQAGTKRLRKGLTLEASHIAALRAADVSEVTVARLEPGDVHEDAAATRLADALVAGQGLRLGPASTGRCNIFAEGPGLARLDADAINRVNAVDPMITVATVPQYQRMEDGGMVATVKIISYAVPETALDAACSAARDAVRCLAPKRTKALLIETMIDAPMSDKGARAIAARVKALGGTLAVAPHVRHDTDALADALRAAQADVILILTASATSDPHDTAPEAVRRAGGTVAHFGMPVDPGNLLFIGTLAGVPVIGLPGCARVPALNGADWVLERVMCGVDVTARDIMGMGVGGLLKEIPTRPQPRKPASP